MVTHRYQDGHIMANFRYNPSSGQIERIAHTGLEQHQAEGGRVTTKFLVMQEGRLVFEGSEAELRANQDPYIQKFAKAGTA
jgi:phospholipid/cholesterol/gamma-HCH transport system ATP-binding protein